MAESQTTASEENKFWRRNLVVCLIGSFTTEIAMTLLLPFLPFYVEHLGVKGAAAIAQWSGIAYGATFFSAAFVAPLWGRLGDRYGRKLMLIRASLGMAIAMSLIGMAQNIWQLVLFRLLAGLLGGYTSGSTILVATQTPKLRSAWALGALSSGIMTGSLLGPLIGGILPSYMGIREIFWLSGAMIFLAFLATTFLIKEERKSPERRKEQSTMGWADIPHKTPVVAMLLVGSLLLFALMSIEPIITLYVAQLITDPQKVTLFAGITMSSAALGSILSASHMGKIADRIGHKPVIVATLSIAAGLFIPQAFVTNEWQLIGLRFLMGIALGGLFPCITSAIRHHVPDGVAGRVLGLSTSARYIGQVTGPLIGGFIAGRMGLQAVFFSTASILAIGAFISWFTLRAKAP